jgi:hypothetical protein
LAQASSYSAQNVIKNEFLRTPHILYHAAEHPEGEHVEKEMGKAAVKKLVGDELEEVEIGSQEEMQAAPLRQYRLSWGLRIHKKLYQIHQHIDDKKILRDCWYVAKHLFLFTIYYLRIYDFLASETISRFSRAKLLKISLLGAKKDAKQLFFKKKVIFF